MSEKRQKAANGDQIIGIGPGTHIGEGAAILPFEQTHPQYWTQRPPLSPDEVAQISEALPEALTRKIDAGEKSKIVEAVGHYIYETYGTNSEVSASEVVASDPLLHHAFAVGVWIIPEDRIFDVSGIPSGTKQRANAVDQRQRQQAKPKELVDFILKLPRDPLVPTMFSTTQSIEHEASQLLEIFGDQSVKVKFKDGVPQKGEANFDIHTSMRLIHGLINDHYHFMKAALELTGVEGVNVSDALENQGIEPNGQVVVVSFDAGDGSIPRQADYVETSIDEFAKVSRIDTLAKYLHPETFEAIYTFDDTPFVYPAIATRIPESVVLSDGSKWNVRLPESPVALSQNARAMNNCTVKPQYAAEIIAGEALVLIVEPADPDPEIPLAEQAVNVEYNKVGKTWYPIQVNPHDDGRSGAEVHPEIREIFEQELADVVRGLSAPTQEIAGR